VNAHNSYRRPIAEWEKEFSVKIKDVMSPNPACCLPSDTAQQVAKLMCERNVGSMPVVIDQQSRKLVGMITDRDLCCSVVAQGRDPKSTPIEQFISTEPIACRDGENVEKCEKAMQEHKVRRIPIVDSEDRVIGIVSQADLALHDKPERVSKTVAEISRPLAA
jgi:CBS domain-containing protein